MALGMVAERGQGTKVEGQELRRVADYSTGWPHDTLDGVASTDRR
jgi:hypothetical protein